MQAQELCSEIRQHPGEGLPVSRDGHIGRHAKPIGAGSYAGYEHFLFIAYQCVKVALGDFGAFGDLERVGLGKTLVHKCRESSLEDPCAVRSHGHDRETWRRQAKELRGIRSFFCAIDC
jgi:hypothetical protein